MNATLPSTGAPTAPHRLSTLDRFLPLWIGAAMVLGIALGKLFPGLDDALDNVKIDTAVDGEAAMSAIRLREPDLLLLDLHMPKLNGIEVCMALRGERLAERTTIISVSAGAQDDNKQLLYQLGIHHFVEKGTQLKERLSAAIYDAMGIDKRTERPTQF